MEGSAPQSAHPVVESLSYFLPQLASSVWSGGYRPGKGSSSANLMSLHRKHYYESNYLYGEDRKKAVVQFPRLNIAYLTRESIEGLQILYHGREDFRTLPRTPKEREEHERLSVFWKAGDTFGGLSHKSADVVIDLATTVHREFSRSYSESPERYGVVTVCAVDVIINSFMTVCTRHVLRFEPDYSGYSDYYSWSLPGQQCSSSGISGEILSKLPEGRYPVLPESDRITRMRRKLWGELRKGTEFPTSVETDGATQWRIDAELGLSQLPFSSLPER